MSTLKLAPLWKPDAQAKECSGCFQQFNLITRRHHCRSCGSCICGSCSTKKLFLKYCYHKGEVRVCDICYTHATGIHKYRTSSSKILRNPDNTILFGAAGMASKQKKSVSDN